MASPHTVTGGPIASMQCAPFPPGLEPDAATVRKNLKSKMIDEAADEMRAVALESIESHLTQLGDGNEEAIITSVRKVVLADVDSRVKEKAEEMWTKGKTVLASIQTKHKEKTQALATELAECLGKQQALEADNEKLKQVLRDLAGRFQMFGTVFAAQKAGVGGMGGIAGDMSTVASTTMSPNQASVASASELFSPATFTPGTTESKAADPTGAAAKFAEVPAFPFPPASPAAPQPSQPLSLAEHLLRSPQPLSLASSLSPAGTPETKNGSEATGQDGTFTFSFTLRKADGTDLGLNVSHREQDRTLCVEGVRSEGAVEAWNRQCVSSMFAEKAVLPGDTITSVNGIMFDPKKMLEECRDKQLLKIVVVRQRQLAKPPTQLRADASEFVPGAPAAAGSASPEDAEKPTATEAEAAPESSDEAAADAAKDEAPKTEE